MNRFGNEQDDREQQPYADHGVHPPEIHRPKTAPQVKPRRHIKAAQPHNQDRRPRLPGKTAFDGLEGMKLVLTEHAPPTRSTTVVTMDTPPIQMTMARTWSARAKMTSFIVGPMQSVKADRSVTKPDFNRQCENPQIQLVPEASRTLTSAKDAEFVLEQTAPLIRTPG